MESDVRLSWLRRALLQQLFRSGAALFFSRLALLLSDLALLLLRCDPLGV